MISCASIIRRLESLPDPEKPDSYVEHAGQLRRHWPSSSELGSFMLERYGKPPSP